MTKIQGKVLIDTNRCKGCGLCIVECPLRVIALGEKINTKGYNYAQIAKPSECIGCANCGYVCPDSCITVYRAKKR
ncbi:MAG: 4Fe-4S binding protein [Candidatus Azobacteroides pseudotrichonymphae]|jgi:2-oxoglutarate ferredoxin oxidoreductase subunit delta|nr:MAG: 4Fe-4S binding protein [Candidatus Azobacteroides pseudotrichonymphae]